MNWTDKDKEKALKAGCILGFIALIALGFGTMAVVKSCAKEKGEKGEKETQVQEQTRVAPFIEPAARPRADSLPW